MIYMEKPFLRFRIARHGPRTVSARPYMRELGLNDRPLVCLMILAQFSCLRGYDNGNLAFFWKGLRICASFQGFSDR